MTTIVNDFEIGDTVYLVTDSEQLPRLFFCIKVYKNDLLYEVAQGTNTSVHYTFELSKEKDILLKLS
jgi:hypothetical protein